MPIGLFRSVMSVGFADALFINGVLQGDGILKETSILGVI